MGAGSERVGIVVQVRMESTRLPGKALLSVEGKPLLHRLCDRVARSRRTAAVVVATSDDAADQALEDACRSWKIPVVRGPMTDLVARLLLAAEAHDLTAMVRVTGDNPLTDPGGIDSLIAAHEESAADLVHNKHRAGYPYGTGAELVATAALRRYARLVHDPELREDFITRMRAEPDQFTCVALRAPSHLIRPSYFLTVDYPQDVEMLARIYRRFDHDDGVPLDAIIRYLDEAPDVVRLNRHLHAGFPE